MKRTFLDILTFGAVVVMAILIAIFFALPSMNWSALRKPGWPTQRHERNQKLKSDAAHHALMKLAIAVLKARLYGTLGDREIFGGPRSQRGP